MVLAEWQPIETAPKDGTRIIFCGPNVAVAEGQWISGKWVGHPTEGWYRTNQSPRVYPTFWMPLPDPPEAG